MLWVLPIVSGCTHSGVLDFTLFSLLFAIGSSSSKEVNFLIVAFPLSAFPRARAKG